MTRAERFRQARQMAGLSWRQVETLTGFSRVTISKTESAKKEHLDFFFETAYTLAKLYGVDVVWLMKGASDDG